MTRDDGIVPWTQSTSAELAVLQFQNIGVEVIRVVNRITTRLHRKMYWNKTIKDAVDNYRQSLGLACHPFKVEYRTHTEGWSHLDDRVTKDALVRAVCTYHHEGCPADCSAVKDVVGLRVSVVVC